MSEHYGTLAESSSLLPKDSTKSVAVRLKGTITAAERVYYEQKFLEMMYSGVLNFIILAHLLMAGAITILATLPNNYSMAIAILGAISTLFAGLQARYKGANLAERAAAHATAIGALLHECEDLVTDCGDHIGNEHDGEINDLRRKFDLIEELADKASRGEMHTVGTQDGEPSDSRRVAEPPV